MSEALQRFLSSANASDLFFDTANESQFSVGEWVSALEYFIQYIQQHNISTTPEMVIGYIKCACNSPEAQPGASLPNLIEEFLQTNGFENRQS